MLYEPQKSRLESIMANPKSLLDCARSFLHHRMVTASARFRLAVSSGFVIASVGMATVVTGQSGQAQDFFSAFGSLFSAPQAAAPQQSGYVSRERAPRSHGYASRRSYRPRVAEQRGGHRRLVSDHTPMRLGRASICVRTCDGFAFPVGEFHGGDDLAAHEATCRSECPGAQTSLYVLPNGSSSIDEAVEARTGRSYSQKASGFHYTTYLDESCSCHPRDGNRVASLLHDFTLRRGDAVVTNTGVKVFHGGGHYPYRQADFVRLAQSRDVQKAAMASFRAIERAAIVSSHPAVAQTSKPVSPAASLKPLDHEASLTP